MGKNDLPIQNDTVGITKDIWGLKKASTLLTGYMANTGKGIFLAP